MGGVPARRRGRARAAAGRRRRVRDDAGADRRRPRGGAPPDAHLATLHGVEAALRFREAYVDHGGVLTDGWRHWQVLDLVAFLPGPDRREGGAVPSAQEAVWRAAGRPDLTVDVARARREALLRDALAS